MYEPVSRYELIEGYDRQPSKEETLYQNEVKNPRKIIRNLSNYMILPFSIYKDR